MQLILQKYRDKIDQLNAFERQTLKSLIHYSTNEGMSRFYMVLNAKVNPVTPVDAFIERTKSNR